MIGGGVEPRHGLFGDPAARTPSRALTRPAVSNEAAAAVVKHYNEVNNAANRRRDDKLIATIEGGNLSSARARPATRSAERWTSRQGPDQAVHVHQARGRGAAVRHYPMRFVVLRGHLRHQGLPPPGVWERKTAGSPWMLTFAAAPPTAAKVPDITGLRAVTNADAKRLAAAPQAAATGTRRVPDRSVRSPRVPRRSLPNADVTKLLATVADWHSTAAKKPRSTGSVSDQFTIATPPTAFVTKSGAALVFATVTEDFKLDDRRQLQLQLVQR